MYQAEDFKQAFEDYVQFNRDLLNGVTPLEGLVHVFGFGKKPGNDPGHLKFLNEIESAINQVVSEKPDPVTAGEIMDVIFGARREYADEKISPYLFAAVEGKTLGLIPFLSPEKAQALYTEYKKLPFNLRVPVMKQILSALKKRFS